MGHAVGRAVKKGAVRGLVRVSREEVQRILDLEGYHDKNWLGLRLDLQRPRRSEIHVEVDSGSRP